MPETIVARGRGDPLARLKGETERAHRALEDALPLADPALDRARYVALHHWLDATRATRGRALPVSPAAARS